MFFTCSVQDVSPPHLALKNDHLEAVEALVTHGADVESKYEQDQTPIQLAHQRKNDPMQKAFWRGQAEQKALWRGQAEQKALWRVQAEVVKAKEGERHF